MKDYFFLPGWTDWSDVSGWFFLSELSDQSDSCDKTYFLE